MSNLMTQHNGRAKIRRALLKTRNPFKGSDRNNLPCLDDAFKESRSITASSDLYSTNTEAEEYSRQSELSNKSLWSLSLPLTSSSPNASALLSDHQGAVNGARCQMFESFGFDDFFSQTPSPISNPSHENWVLDLEENVSHLADNSFFEGNGDTSAIRSSNESSIYDVSQGGIDQSSSDFFEDVDRLKALATPEKNREQVDEASRLERLKHEIRGSSFCFDGTDDFERGSNRSESEENSSPVGRKASIFSVCCDLGSTTYDKKSPIARGGIRNNLFFKDIEGNLPSAFGPGCEEKILAESAVKDILGLRTEWPLGVDEFSKLSIDEASDVHHVNVADYSSLCSRDSLISPSIGSGFFSERHREMRRLGLFKISPIVFEKRKEMTCEAYQKEHGRDYLLSYICSDAPDSPTEQASIQPSLYDQHKRVELNDREDERDQELYSSSKSDSTDDSRIISPRRKLFASQNKAPLKTCTDITNK